MLLADAREILALAANAQRHMTAPDWQEVGAAIDSWLDGVLDPPGAAAKHAYRPARWISN